MNKYTKRKFGAELILFLEKTPYDVDKIARWADEVYNENLREIDDELDGVIQDISSMSFGPEFERSEVELRKLALNLIKSGLTES